MDQPKMPRPLSDLIAEVDSDVGRKRVHDYLEQLPYPHYKPVEGRPGFLYRIEANSTKTIGRFVKGNFEADEHRTP